MSAPRSSCSKRPELKAGSIADLAKELNAGSVDTLVILGGNPVYNAPADLKWADAQAKAKTVIRLGYYEDETFPAKGWSLPLAHYLESWGDARTYDGTLVAVQPLIEPLFGGLTEIEVLARIVGTEATSPYEIVRATFRGIASRQWRRGLEEIFIQRFSCGQQRSASAGRFDLSAVTTAIAAAALRQRQRCPPRTISKSFSIAITRVDDGRLQQQWLDAGIAGSHHQDDLGKRVPDERSPPRRNSVFTPATRKTTASSRRGPSSNLTVAKSKAPFGRSQARPTIQLPSPWAMAAPLPAALAKIPATMPTKCARSRTPISVSAASSPTPARPTRLSVTQDHGAMEGRPIIREATLKQYQEHPNFADRLQHGSSPPAFSPLYPNPFDQAKKLAPPSVGHVH